MPQAEAGAEEGAEAAGAAEETHRVEDEIEVPVGAGSPYSMTV